MDNTNLSREFETYLQDIQKKSKHTIVAYTKDVDDFILTFTPKRVEDITEDDLKSYLYDLSFKEMLASKTISRKLNSIRKFFEYLVQSKRLEKNIALKIDHPKIRKQNQRVLSQEEIQKLREATMDDLKSYVIIETLLQTGIKISELSTLKLADVRIKDKQGVLTLSYPKVHREIPINEKLRKSLLEYIYENHSKEDTEKHLFFTSRGNKIHIRNIRAQIDNYIIKAGLINVTVNDLRNTFIVRQLESGLPLTRVAELAGHSNTAATRRYIELVEGDYRETKKSKPVAV